MLFVCVCVCALLLILDFRAPNDGDDADEFGNTKKNLTEQVGGGGGGMGWDHSAG